MGFSLCRRYFSQFCPGNSCSNMRVCNGRFLHRIPESYELSLPKCLRMSKGKVSVDFMMCKHEVLLIAVGSMSEMITRIHIHSVGSTRVHVAIMLVNCFV